jgi:enoyl-CoA hydratase
MALARRAGGAISRRGIFKMSELVRYAKHGPVARITFDDGKVNVMSIAMLRGIAAALDEAENDGAIVVLAGRTGIFTAGFDLKVFAAGDAQAVLEMMRAGAELAYRVLTFPTPIVVACTGHAYPMGAFLLLGADIRIGADGPFRMGLNEVAINIVPPNFGVELARQRLVPAYFQRTTLLGEMFAPQDAVVAGFLDRVVAPEQLLDVANEAAEALTRIDLPSHATTKRRARGPAIAAVRAAIDAEIRLETYAGRGVSRVLLPGAAA